MPEPAKGYTYTPVCMVVRGIPVPRDGTVPTTPPDPDECRWPEGMALGGIVTGTVQAERAQREAEVLLRRCRARLRRGDRAALFELLDTNPAFIWVRWVREALGRLAAGGLLSRRRGRPKGRYTLHPLAVVGVVHYFIETGRARNPEQAFARLEEFGVLPYDSAKRYYYQARRDSRFRPILLEFPEYAQEVAAVDAERPPQHVLGPGVEITATWQDPRLGTVRLTLRGECRAQGLRAGVGRRSDQGNDREPRPSLSLRVIEAGMRFRPHRIRGFGVSAVYTLRRLVPGEPEVLEELLLDGRPMREHGRGPGPALAPGGRVEGNHLLDARETFQDPHEAEANTRLHGLAVEQGGQQQRQDTVEGVDPDLLIGPMKHGLPADERRVFHLLEGGLDVVLRPIGEDDLVGGPVGLVGEEDALAEHPRLEVGVGRVVQPVAHAAGPSPAGALDLVPEQRLEMLAMQEGVEGPLQAFARIS